MQSFVTKLEAAEIVKVAQVRSGKTWAELAAAIDRPAPWAISALLGQHPVPAAEAEKIGELLGLDAEVVEALQAQPTRSGLDANLDDPTIYRFYEALAVYGPAIKELIHEEFGDGIMSAINFKLDVQRREDPDGDRVVVTFDGKFLDYRW